MTFAPTTGGESVVTSITISKDGERRREEEISAGRRVVYLDVPDGRFLVLPDEKIYAPIVNGLSKEPQSSAEPIAEISVHTSPSLSTYENLGTEIVNGKTTSKYRVVVNNSGGDNVTNSETLIWIDESVGMPVKSVTRSATGTQTMELSNLTLTVDTKQFELPQNYQKLELRALQQRIR